MDVWVEQEIAECAFPDQRLKTRLGKLLSRLGQKIGATLPALCQDWAATKAGYRFLSQVAHGRSSDKPDRCILYCCVAGVLANDDEYDQSKNIS